MLSHTNDVERLPNEFRDWNGFVEIVFDFTIEKESGTITKELRLKRRIESGISTFFRNEKPIERLEIKNFLQHEGFSTKSPVHYVLLSKIYEMQCINPAERYQLLKNCLNDVEEFNVAIEKSKRLLSETKEQMGKINKSLAKIFGK